MFDRYNFNSSPYPLAYQTMIDDYRGDDLYPRGYKSQEEIDAEEAAEDSLCDWADAMVHEMKDEEVLRRG